MGDSGIFVLITTLVCIKQVQASGVCGTPPVNHERDLLKCLFDNYNSDARPVDDVQKAVKVNLTLTLMKVIDVAEKDHIFVSKGWIQMKWKDDMLKWNPDEHDGLKRAWVDPVKIWRPDIYIYNYAEDMYETMLETPALLQYTGEVMWVPSPSLIKTYCRLDLTWFPYDKQTCKMVFGTWSYDMSQVDIVTSNKNSSSAPVPYEGHEWDVTDFSWKRREFSWGDFKYPTVIYEVKLVRQPTYYRHIFVIPSFLNALLTCFMFLMPIDAGERFSLGAGLLISNSILLSMTENHMPTEMGDVPAIVVYLTYNLIMLTVGLLMSLMVFNFHHREYKRGKVPNIIRQIFLGKLSRCLCVRSESYLSVPTEDGGLESATGGAGPNNNSPGTAELRTSSELLQDTVTPLDPKLALDTTLVDIRKYLRLLASKASIPQEMSSHRQSVISEWYQVATVMDRMCFVAYFIITLLITAVFYGHKS